MDSRNAETRSDYSFLACLPDGMVVGGCGIDGTAGEQKARYTEELSRALERAG